MRLSKIIRLVAIGVLALLSAMYFLPVRDLLLEVFKGLLITWDVLLNLLAIATIAILFAALLAPLEALGWWAGWYGDEITTTQHPGILAEPFPTELKVTRYVVYLDGISQAQVESLPEVEQFLDRLAEVLTDDIVLIKGIIPYSVLNKPLTQDRLLSFFWRLADRLQMNPSGGIFGALVAATINIRNILIVSVSADQRYGPIYNQGTAQVIYNSLLTYGYQPSSGIPLTLLGYSGGGQLAVGAAPYLKRALQAPIEVISLSGVMSGNHNILELEHLYHIVGNKDWIEKEGPVMFPRRWRIFPLSYWNRAKRRGKISFISLEGVGHNGKSGPYGDTAILPDGRTHLQQTLDIVAGILQDQSPLDQHTEQITPSNYDLYQQAPFNQPSYYPIAQSLNPSHYQPIAPWMGRLILPPRDRRFKGVWIELYHAPEPYQHLIGQTVVLRWSDQPRVRRYRRVVAKDLHFSEDAEYSQNQGSVHPNRLDHWHQVDPLESLAGSRPYDDVIVQLKEPIEIDTTAQPASLTIAHEPVQITGRFYALVRLLQPVQPPPTPDIPPEWFRVVHFNRSTRRFDGDEETLYFPAVVFAKHYGSYPSTTRNLEKSPANASGWYVYGAKNASGDFVVQSIAPRALHRLQPDEIIADKTDGWNYIKHQAWKDLAKGTLRSVLVYPQAKESDPQSENLPAKALPPSPAFLFPEGSRALLLHLYGGIGGKHREPAAGSPIFFGHFAYGLATVVREPLADELKFEIEYYQVYTHNVDGIVAGTLAWNRFLGDRQVGWLGTRPTSDLLIKLDAFTEDYEFGSIRRSALDVLIEQLEAMTARYRIGDGTGGTYVGAAHNCAQDSNQAMYAAIKQLQDLVGASLELQEWLLQNSEQAQRFRQLVKLGKSIKHQLFPFGAARADWQNGEGRLGISPEEDAFESLRVGLISWRTLLPRLASETIVNLFLQQNAAVWILRTNQVGGYDPDIEPIAPTPLGW
ncbi:CAAX protease [Phormidium tenue FACHB-886]|nr:CAAX protease [Phormidium tenue FACHB-886]